MQYSTRFSCINPITVLNTSTCQFLAEIRADLAELKGSYDLDYSEELSARNKLISHLIFEILPSQLKREIIYKTGRNYPILNDIFKSYSEAISTLLQSKFLQEKTEQFFNRIEISQETESRT